MLMGVILSVSSTFHRKSPSFNITISEAISLSNVELQKGQVNLTYVLQTGETLVVFTGALAFLFKALWILLSKPGYYRIAFAIVDYLIYYAFLDLQE